MAISLRWTCATSRPSGPRTTTRLRKLRTLPSTCSTGRPCSSVISESSPSRNNRSRIRYIGLPSSAPVSGGSPRSGHHVGSPHRHPWRGDAKERRSSMNATRKLYRSKTNRQVAGVCGGLAEYFNLDVTLIRVLFVLLAVLGGSRLVLFVAMWIIVPKDP